MDLRVKHSTSDSAVPLAGDALQTVIDALSANIAIIDSSGEVIAVNEAWRAFGIANAARNDSIGANYLKICETTGKHNADARRMHTGLLSVISGARQTRRLRYTMQLRGDEHHFIVTLASLRLNSANYVLVAHNDVTLETKQGAQKRQRALELMEVQEEERRIIARELHDSTSQHLVAIGLMVGRLAETVQSPEEVETIAELRGLIAEAHREIRTFSYLLHPPSLTERGLRYTLEDYVEGFSRRTRLPVDLTWSVTETDLSGAIETAIFRIVQEALANSYKHSGASSVQVQIGSSASELCVSITDDGCGFTHSASVGNSSTVGLSGMHARVLGLKGTLRFLPVEVGTKLVATIPITQKAQSFSPMVINRDN